MRKMLDNDSGCDSLRLRFPGGLCLWLVSLAASFHDATHPSNRKRLAANENFHSQPDSMRETRCKSLLRPGDNHGRASAYATVLRSDRFQERGATTPVQPERVRRRIVKKLTSSAAAESNRPSGRLPKSDGPSFIRDVALETTVSVSFAR